MNNRLTGFILLIFILSTFSGCSMIEDIFAAGAWAGAIGVLIVVAIVFIIVRAVKQ
ncbi:MAG: hypothetical protein WEB89_04210 [Balneolales bacterium]